MFNFPPWATTLRSFLPLLVGGGILYLVVLVWYGGSPLTTDVGYSPVQPIPYSHALHAGDMGMDCRYCHVSVDSTAQAGLPTSEICMNCHERIRASSESLAVLRESFASGNPIPWVKIHDLPDFVYFNHSAHVSRGVGCVSCHGRIDTMEQVRQVEKLSMGWCLDCHRAPEKHLRPLDTITQMDWKPNEDQWAVGARIRAENDINPPQDCSTCHR